MPGKPWSDEDKQAALLLLADDSKSFYDIKAETGIPVGTLHRWSVEAGIEHSSEKTKAANVARRERLASKREALAEEFLDRVEDLLSRMDQPHVIAYTKDGKPVVHGVGASADCKNYVTAAAIALDKFRLEMGEHTEHRKTDSDQPRHKVQDKVDELAERRAKAV